MNEPCYSEAALMRRVAAIEAMGCGIGGNDGDLSLSCFHDRRYYGHTAGVRAEGFRPDPLQGKG
ncbi:hypothetical protein, partial [Mesorhizobium qingshengii]